MVRPIMRSRTVVNVAIGMLAVLTVNQALKVRRGIVTAACEWGGPASYRNYCMAAQTDLENRLTRQGFTISTNRQFSASGMHWSRETEEWFVSGADKSLPFYVGIRTPQGDSAGLVVEVAYDFDNYRWQVSESEKYIREFNDSITKWWTVYREQHPGGPPLPDTTLTTSKESPQ